jgi:sulfate/thiosulfate transport system permease protein
LTLLDTPPGAPEPTASPTSAATVQRPAGGAAATAGLRLGKASGLGLGTAVLWLSLLILIPLSAVIVQAFDSGWAGFWHAITTPQAKETLELTIISSLIVAVINAVMGTLIAWVLVRDDFPGKRILEFVIDIPFALPTIVAGLVLLAV